MATLAEVNVLVSGNFKHVVNLRRIKGFNAVNLGLGCHRWRSELPGRSWVKMNEKPFDCVRLMRVLRDELSRKMMHMTSEERVEFINREGERGARGLGLPPAIDPRIVAERARAARQAESAGSPAPTRAA